MNVKYLGAGEPFFLASSRDGAAALIGGQLSHSVGSALTAADTPVATYFDMALAVGDHINSVGSAIFDNANHWQNSTTSPFASFVTAETFLYGSQFNSTGSLLYRSAATHIRIYDAAHGNLVRTIEVPGGLASLTATPTNSPSRLLAIDPAGQNVITVTNAGLSVFTSAADPLSIASTSLLGSQLTLAGSGFFPTDTVLIDSVAVQLTYIDHTRVVVTLPPGMPSGAHAVTITDPNGNTYTLSLAFTT